MIYYGKTKESTRSVTVANIFPRNGIPVLWDFYFFKKEKDYGERNPL